MIIGQRHDVIKLAIIRIAAGAWCWDVFLLSRYIAEH